MSATRFALVRLIPLAVALLLLAGCAAPAGGPSSTVTVFAAASLQGSFERLAEEFTAEHPGVEVEVNFGGSAGLAAQLVEGARADVFAAADESTMQTVVDAGAATGPLIFTTNTLQIVVPAGNPGEVAGLADFADPDLAITLCDSTVPCGAASQRVFDLAGVTPQPDTLEDNVTAVLTRVELGEADAGLVYVTDVRAAGAAVEGLAVPEAAEVVNRYPIALLDGAPHPDAARAFIDYVLSDDGQRMLADAGFVAP